MIRSPEVYRTATVMFEHYGAGAKAKAAELAAAMALRGDVNGQHVWLAIVRAIDEIIQRQQAEPALAS